MTARAASALLAAAVGLVPAVRAQDASAPAEAFRAADLNGERVEEVFRRTRRMMQAWIGYADAIESALYLYAREPVPEARDWIESEIRTLIAFQQPDGTVERWYGDGNWARTLLLYAMWKTQGCYLDAWRDGVRLGAVREGERLFVSLEGPAGFRAGWELKDGIDVTAPVRLIVERSPADAH